MTMVGVMMAKEHRDGGYHRVMVVVGVLMAMMMVIAMGIVRWR